MPESFGGCRRPVGTVACLERAISLVELFSSALFTRAVDQFAELATTGDCADHVGLPSQRSSNGITRRPVLATEGGAVLVGIERPADPRWNVVVNTDVEPDL